MQAPDNKVKQHWLVLLLIPVASLFFIGGPDSVTAPFLRYAWNMGHIGFFLIATVAYSRYRPFTSTLQVFYYLASVLILSFVIEGTQRVVGRSMSTMDIMRNLIGCALALWFVARPFLHISVISFLSFVLVIDLGGLTIAGYTDYLFQSRAPVIEDFESEFSIARWDGNLVSSSEHVLTGQLSGKAIFIPGEYATMMLSPTLKNWSAYNSLELNIYNPQDQTVRINVRIHDKMHALSADQEHVDRFNRSYELTTGWNQLSIDLDDIKHAPKARLIDMTSIYALGLFMSNLETAQELYFDEFVLRK